ncbi:DUF3349 domain-containing protein [Mycobacterium sherrisii]|uniref:DUF3349 domain-containing protein n=1 Tax=Mycobacterium sherrisii TaxID=243061 RepID=UPI002DDD73E1|nr:DUF3349 domain-containing protein [Mycobacterium sherrisii]MEC4765288.1 DUF3349 domain-containing protein [Mycobacterium sherrisii]
MGMSTLLSRTVRFLREGYPPEMPPTGYVPLVALLPRRGCDNEFAAVTTQFARGRERDAGARA